MEIEKKYLITTIPFELDSFEKHEIVQCYLNPVQHGIERRIRKKNNKFYYTEKSFGDLIREENEKEITEEEFDNLLKEKVNNILYKDRFHIPYKQHTIELDVYKEQLSGLIMADVEFSSLEEADKFSPPDWFYEDITFSKKYKNYFLAQLDNYSELTNQ